MTTTNTPATITAAKAAKAAKVSIATIRIWCRMGAVDATKKAGRWVITIESLQARIGLRQVIEAERTARRAAQITELADFTPYKDKSKARDNVFNLIADGALIPLIPTVYLAVSKTDENKTYIVDTDRQACDCRGNSNWGYCSHLTAANAIEAYKPARRHALAA